MNITRKHLCVLVAFLVGVAVVCSIILAVAHHAQVKAEEEAILPLSLQFDPSTEELTFVPVDGFYFHSITVNNGKFPVPSYDQTTRSVSVSLREFFAENAETGSSYLGLYFGLHSNDTEDCRYLQYCISQSREKQAIVVDIYPSGDVADPTGSTTEEFPLEEA